MAKPLNTRIAERFRPDGRSVISILPVNAFTKITAYLIDVNKFGGLGIFVSSRTAFDRLPLETFLEPWSVMRSSTKGTITFNVMFFHAIPKTEEGRKGIRISAMLAEKEAGPTSKMFMSPRRRSKRIMKDEYPVRLAMLENKIVGRLLNVGDDDGIGIQLERPELRALTWGDIFHEGWSLGQTGYSLPLYIQRLSYQDGKIVVGGSAPGISRARQQKSPSAVSPADDEELMNLLDRVMTKRK